MPWTEWDVLFDGSERQVSEEERALNTRYRDRIVLFGDGAGAALVCPGEGDGEGVLDVLVHTDGTMAEKLWVPGGGSAYRPYFAPAMSECGDIVPVVEGREVYRMAVTLMPEVVLQILERNGLTPDDVDLLVMHQANLRINEAVQKRLGLADEKVFNNIERYGNTTAATIPMAFHEARKAGRVRPGDLVCFVALGSGVNWGAVLYRT
jgi:3-oxoacyl-[acyl-carrier-protein] synthase-3